MQYGIMFYIGSLCGMKYGMICIVHYRNSLFKKPTRDVLGTNYTLNISLLFCAKIILLKIHLLLHNYLIFHQQNIAHGRKCVQKYSIRRAVIPFTDCVIDIVINTVTVLATLKKRHK